MVAASHLLPLQLAASNNFRCWRQAAIRQANAGVMDERRRGLDDNEPGHYASAHSAIATCQSF